jgi:hypothetical protein
MYHYFPDYKPVPSFHNKNELQLNGSFGDIQQIASPSNVTDIGSSPFLYDLQMNYSVTKNLFMGLQFVYDLQDISYFDIRNQISISKKGIDLGYFKWSNNFLIGIKSGIQIGKLELKYYDKNSTMPNNLFFYSDNLKYSICPFLGYETEYSQIALQLDCSELKYYNINNQLTKILSENDFQYFKPFQTIKNPFINYFIEPSITLKSGFKNAKIVFQEIKFINFGNKSLNYMKFTSYVGFEFNFDINKMFDYFNVNNKKIK